MMFENRSMGLYADFDAKIALKSVDVDTVFNDLLCETVMTQVYQNLEKKNIEAIYTFPLPCQATLLELKVCIGDRELNGFIVEKFSAESQYEDALIEGNTAIMLEQPGSGVYTMNVGNILPKETVSVSIKYAELYGWQGDNIRFFLPTTIAPRYGDPEKAGFQPHQVPGTGILAENQFRLQITIIGNLRDAIFDSPSHQIIVQNESKKTIVTLAAGGAFMDRDFILNMNSTLKEKDMALVGRDLEGGYAVVASFVPNLPGREKVASRSIKILLDCSGSMAGDSIVQARQAVDDFLGFLRSSDYFNIFTFGSSCRAFFEQQVPVNNANLTRVRRKLRSIEADMGGTEMNKAIVTAIKTRGPAMPQDIFLITDGEIWDGEEIVKTARQSGHRVFTVGVGSAVSEGFVSQIAVETGGAYELVAPNETMAEQIVRHFNRIYLPKADDKAVKWPDAAKKTVPKTMPAVFDGDTLHFFAFFDQKPEGKVDLEMKLANGQLFSQSIILPNYSTKSHENNNLPGTIARLGIQKSLSELSKTTGMALALKYQLISPWTNYIIEAERSEDEKKQGRDLPVLRKVPQMLAAGWGGTGNVKGSIKYCLSCSEPASFSESNHLEDSDIPSFMRRNDNNSGLKYQKVPDFNKIHPTPVGFIFSCNRFHKNIRNFQDLRDCGLPDIILSTLQAIANQYNPDASESLIVSVFLNTLASTLLGGCFNRETLRDIKRSFNSRGPDNYIVKKVGEAFSNIEPGDWGIRD